MQKIIRKIENQNAKMPTRKRVCAYARVSSGKEAMLHSLAAQVSYYSSYIQRQPEWEYSGVFADEATTGTKEARAEFQKMIEQCKNGNIDLIITKSISRFARNTVTVLKTVRELKALGVEVYFEEENIYSLSGDGELMLTILASYAQEESLSASENTKWRLRKNFNEGIPNTLRMYGYDFACGNLIVNPAEAKVVKMIYADYLSGMGKNAIVRKLCTLGVPTKNGGSWGESVISKILTNEKLTGNMLLQKSYSTDHLTKRVVKNRGELPMFYVEDTHEPIIDMNTFEKVQDEIMRRKEGVNNKPIVGQSEYTGIIRCGNCGANFRRKTNNASTPYAKIVWSCATFNTRGRDLCNARQIPENILKDITVEVLGLESYNADTVTDRILCIKVPDDGVLVFVLFDGTEIARNWQNPSRKDSWTDDMKEKARLKARRRNNGKC